MKVLNGTCIIKRLEVHLILRNRLTSASLGGSEFRNRGAWAIHNFVGFYLKLQIASTPTFVWGGGIKPEAWVGETLFERSGLPVLRVNAVAT